MYYWIYVYIVAAITGFIMAFAAYLLHGLISFVTSSANIIVNNYFTGVPERCLAIFLLPMIGFIISRMFQGRDFNKSLAPLILKLDRRLTAIPFSEMFTHLLSSAFSVGFGGSAGLEAPSVLTGAAIGSNISRIFRVKRISRATLVGCGAAAGISAVFDSPIAGVLFVAEALLPEFTLPALMPPIVASAVACLTVRGHAGYHGCMFPEINAGFGSGDILPLIICGLICALAGAYIIKSTAFAGGLISRIKKPGMRLLVGGMLACSLLFVFPFLRSQGYHQIRQLLIGDESAFMEAPFALGFLSGPFVPIVLIASAILIKPIVSSFSIGTGDGGIFAPTMFTGAFVGFATARIINLSGLASVSEASFAAYGICGVFTTVMRSPLAGIFLVVETTNSFGALAPLMIISAIALAMGHCFEPHSIYKKSLIAQGFISDDKVETILKHLRTSSCIFKTSTVFKPATHLAEAFLEIKSSQTDERVFPVVYDDGILAGVVNIEKLFSVAMSDYNRDMEIREIMALVPYKAKEDESLDQVLSAMIANNTQYLPVVDADGRYVGFISKDAIFDKYRDENTEMQHE